MTQPRGHLIREAEAAWLQDDLATSTRALRDAANVHDSFVREAEFDPTDLPDGVSAEALLYRGRDVGSHIVRFDRCAAVFDVGIPILPDGTLFSRAFSHLKYPERYSHLFSDETSQVLRELFEGLDALADGYVVPIRPPYYHWLLDTVPHLLGASHLDSSHSVNLIGPAEFPPSAWQRELLSRAAGLFGVDNLNWIPTTGTAVATAPGYAQTRMPLAERLRLLTELAPRRAAGADAFLYMRRGPKDGRQLINENEIIQALGPRFTVMEPGAMSLDDQMTAFAGARCIVGVHGSNLANIVFCAPGTKVIEIAAGLPQPHFEQICAVAGLSFHRVAATPMENANNANPTWAQAHGNLRVAPDKVIATVEAALAE